MASGDSPRRVHLGLVLRTAAAITLLVVAYYQAPLDRPLTFASGVFLVGALLLAALVVVVEVRGILASTQPMLRAIRVIALGLPLLLVLFAATYITVDGQQTDAFSEPLSRTDGLYFTVTTFATVGFGDITPADRTGPGPRHRADDRRPDRRRRDREGRPRCGARGPGAEHRL